ncbi:hypothetical protein [Desulfosporosinus sp. SB140]|uniref:hypothetical protein n=1 Tax=Desulfosporosinus paludis TaxID=3115649 RepID=UPI00388D10B0
MVKKENELLHKSRRVAAGSMIAILIALGISGCGTQQTASTQQTQAESTQSQTDQGQENKGQMSVNPAVKAAMDILQLQHNDQVALTSEQTSTIKPILQELIDTSDPTNDVLQKKADAITSLFTDQQKSFLAQGPGGNSHNSNNNSTNPSDNTNTSNTSDKTNSSNGTSVPQNGTKPTNGNPSGGNEHSFNAQDIYKQALAALK